MDGQPDVPGSIGGRVGSRLAGVVADATIATRQRLGPHQAGLAQKVLADFTNHVSDELRSVMGPIWRAAAEDTETPEELRPLFRALGTQRGQAWAWIAGTATGAAMGGGLMNLLTNALNPVVLPLIAAAPHGILSPSDAAAVWRAGLSRKFNALHDSRSGGIDDDRFTALVELGRPLPTVDELRAMLNRGDIAEGAAVDVLRRYGYAQAHHADLLGLRRTDHSAPEIAAMWNRGIVDTGTANSLAARVGVNTTQMRRLLELGGEPPAPAELLLAWRRGIVTEAQVDRALRQGPLRFEWIPVIKSLQWQPLTVTEAADAVNQGHMDEQAARKVARENGVRDADFDVIVANAGIPPGPQEALDWVNRGLLTEQGFRSIFLESRIKNKYIDLYLKSRHETMPPETVRLMYSRGAMAADDALRRLQQRGYSREDAAIILDGASAEKTQADRNLTVAQIRDLYAERLISRDDALAMLGAAGYESGEAEFVIELAELARLRRFATAATNRIKSGYIAGHLSELDTQSRLDALGMPPDFKDDVLALWDIERSTVTRGLTTAQIVAAVKRGFLDPDDGMARLTGQGYSPDDALILLRLGGAVE